MAPKEYVYLVCETAEDGDMNPVEAYRSNNDAKAAAKALESKKVNTVEVKKVELKSEAAEASKYSLSCHLLCSYCH